CWHSRNRATLGARPLEHGGTMLMRGWHAASALAVLLLALACAVPAIADDGSDDQGDDNGGNGNGSSVEFTGSVQAMPPSGLIGTWTIAGKSVQTNAATSIDQEDGTIGVGAVVEVKGTQQADGSVLASRIEIETGVGGGAPGGDQGEDESDFTGAIQSLPPS